MPSPLILATRLDLLGADSTMVKASFGKPACSRISFTINIAGSSFPGGLTVSAWISLERLETVSAVANFQLMGSLICKLLIEYNRNST